MIANPNDGNSPRVEVATPMIDVSAGGLNTATTCLLYTSRCV